MPISKPRSISSWPRRSARRRAKRRHRDNGLAAATAIAVRRFCFCHHWPIGRGIDLCPVPASVSRMQRRRIVVVGGGAAGFFAAVTAAEARPDVEVIILEATAHPLAKVKVSGGGRCNVTHACFEPRELVKKYPRGSRELLGAFHRWQPRDTISWFEARDVTLKTEEDGRMFPITDDSQTIIDCLTKAAAAAGVQLRTRIALRDAQPRPGGGFDLTLSSGETLECDRLMLATGGNKASAGFVVAEKLGHTIEPLAPSLFTFHVDDGRLKELAGISVADTQAAVPGTALRERGPVLITHWGLSGPAILRLSAWGARELQARDYQFSILINWAGGRSMDQVKAELNDVRLKQAKKHAANTPLLGLPQRLWERLVSTAGIAAGTPWTSVSNAALQALAGHIAQAEFKVGGKSMNKEEFVTCGGVRLSEVNFRTMQSRVCPGLYFAGEVLDIDGVTGGFNFQAAWTTGRIAGLAMAD
jgi:predicted Rossmann fold flavoprotein